MNIKAIKDIEQLYNADNSGAGITAMSNTKFIASILADHLDITAKIEIVKQLLSKNNINAEIKEADTPTKFLANKNDKSYCISFYQLFTDPDKVVRYLKKKLK